MSDNPITTQPTAPDPGVEDGTVLTTTTHEGDQVDEKIVYDYADDGTTVLGWHKTAV